MRYVLGAALSCVLLVALAGCSSGEDELILGATTSVQDSGLLDELVAAFEDEHGYHVKPIVQGSGQVLALARQGELDAVMVHAPREEEQALVDDGYAVGITDVMRNHFLVVGPEDDPAGVRGADSPEAAFQHIAEREAGFVSRGDGSGTNAREQATWENAGIEPAGESWYRESAQGQGQTLLLASDTDAYTLVDSSTFITFEERIQLIELYRFPEPNVYSLVELDAGRLGKVNADAQRAWLEFMASDAARELISSYGREEYGVPLFEPLPPGD